METKIRWTENAVSNLNHLHAYIFYSSITYANNFITSLIKAVEAQLQLFPLIGRNIPEFEGTQLSFLKEVIFKVYRVIYNPVLAPESITILTVMNGRKDILRNIKKEWELE